MSEPEDPPSYGVRVVDADALKIDPAAVRRIRVRNDKIDTLIQPRPDRASHTRPLHSDILHRLSTVDPDAAQCFAAREQYVQELRMRFVNPLYPQALDPLHYDAVTYSWHRDTWNLCESLTPTLPNTSADQPKGSVTSPLSQEMWKVLLAESASFQNLLWIDQICIQQDDRKEKQAAVGFTDRIYQNADRVLVVIEDKAVSEEAVSAIAEVAALDVPTITEVEYQNLGVRTVQLVTDLCITLFSARVFSRSWCWHEYSNSREHIIFMPILGSTPERPRILRLWSRVLVRLWLLVCHDQQQLVDAQMLANIRISETWFMAHRAVRKLVGPYVTPTLPEAFRYAFRTRASRKNDQLSIVLNMCGYDLIYTGPPLEDEDDCYRLLHSVALAAGDTSVIGCNGINVRNGNGEFSSWLLIPASSEAELGYPMINDTPVDMPVHVDLNGTLSIDIVFLAVVKDVQLPESPYLDTAIAFMELDFTDIYERSPFVFERHVHASTLDIWIRFEMRQRYISQKLFYAQVLSFLISHSQDEFLQEVLDPRLKRSTANSLPSGMDTLLQALTWLRGHSLGPNACKLLQSRPESIADHHLKAVASFVEHLVSTVLGIDGSQIGASIETWDSYAVGSLKCEAVGNETVLIAVPRRHLDALIVVPADVSDAKHSLLRRVWIIEKSLNDNGAGDSQISGTGASSSQPQLKYRLLSKTKFHKHLDVSQGERQMVMIQ